ILVNVIHESGDAGLVEDWMASFAPAVPDTARVAWPFVGNNQSLGTSPSILVREEVELLVELPLAVEPVEFVEVPEEVEFVPVAALLVSVGSGGAMGTVNSWTLAKSLSMAEESVVVTPK